MKKLRIGGNRIFHVQDGFVPDELYIADEKLVSREMYENLAGDEEYVDAGNSYVIPGLCDIHFHGCAGYDCCDGTVQAFRQIALYEAGQGITSITPATMTMPEEVLAKVARAAREYADTPEPSGADLCGLYMEGPFISEAKKGAQKAEYVKKPDAAMFRRLQEAAGGLFRSVVIAPETEGAFDFIRAIADEVHVSAGHTMADYDTVKAAIDCGIAGLTHLYNGMLPFTHRAPGPVGAAADDKECMAELICDGVHIHPAVVRSTLRMFGEDRIIMISDSMRAAGMPDGESELGGQKVYVNGRYATLADDTLAGSVTNLMDCVRTAVKEMDVPLHIAVKCAAVNPARAIGIYGDHGSLEPGKYADIVKLSEDLALENVWIRGKLY